MATMVDCFHFLCIPPVKARLKEFLVHLKSYETRLKELKAKIKNLKNARDTVQHKVDEEDKRYGNGIPKEVTNWIKAVDAVISVYDKFDGDKDHKFAQFDFFESGYLPKPGIRLRLSREALTITRKVNEQLETAKHDTYSYWLGPPSIASFLNTVGYESFPSREESMKKIKEALKSPNVRVIGIHGLSGVGKTTLVKKIARDALQASEAAKIFDVVAMASVTRKPDIRQIQGHIADALGLKLDEETDMARAARIEKRLKNGSTLIILDDLWATLDLNKLGIPLDVDDSDDQNIWTETVKEVSSGNVKEGKNPGLLSKTKTIKETSGNLKEGKTPGELRKTKSMKEIPAGEHSKTKSEGNSSVINTMKSKKLQSASNMKIEETLSHYKGCKVLMISENKQVLLNQMGGEENSIYFIKVLKEKEAEAFFKKMAGMGNGKTEFEKLMMSIVNKCNGLPMSIVTTARALKDQSQSVWEDAVCKLERGKFTGTSDFSTKLSYDLLEDEELKRAFLLCAGMGPDTLIMDLMKYCVGLGFLQRIYTVQEARVRVCVLVGKLKESGLLSDSYSSDRFTMQDIVRNAALSIASKDSHTFTRTKEQIDEWPDNLEMYTISLHHCHITEGFPTRINCTRLRFFQVNNNDLHLKIPKHFFEEMNELRVLILAGISLSLLDSSASSLTELRMLSLEQCMLLDKELSVIGKLKKLRILSFSGSDIENLPVELNQLKKLQIFDISNCSKLREIPPNVISSLISLEELYMRNTLIQWKVKEHNCLSELRHLYQLTTLDIHIPIADHFPKNLFFDKLTSYKIVVGDSNAYSDMVVKMPEKYEASRFLAIQLKKGDIHSQKGIKMLFETVEILFLEELNGVQDIFFRLNLKGFPYLKHLLIANNSDIQSLINPKDRQHEHTEKAFSKLESLHLYNLKKMNKICSCKLSEPSFRKLKVIKINLCGELSNVVLFSVVSLLTVLETIEVSECDTLTAIVASDTESNSNEREVLNFPELRSLTLLSLPELIGFYPVSLRGAKVTELFDEKVELPKLERMVLSSIQINKVWSDQSLKTSCFKNLIYMDVNDCWNLEYLISFSMATSLVNLQSLFVSECEKMSYIFQQGSQAKTKGDIFPNLKNIKLSSMKSLKEIWNSELLSNSFEKLDTLIIEECDKLVNVFPCDVEGMFQSLCTLRVTNCKSMEAVFELDVKKRTDVVVSNMQYVYLTTLPKLEHVWKKGSVGILELKSLQKMCIIDCHRLENIFPASVARKFPSLEYLEIRECFELNVIVPVFKKVGTNNDRRNPVQPSFEFPNLTTIRYSVLPKLLGFYPEAYKLSCPALNDLSIECCDRLEPFKKSTTDPQTIFSKEVIKKLKCMKIESWHVKSSTSYMGEEGNHRQDNLEELCLSGLTNSGILYSFLHRNPTLRSLSLNKCFVTDIVPPKMPPEIENLGVVPKLERLTLIDMPNLETIGFEEGIILERIESLILKNCSLLVNIMPSSVSLTHLTNLEVVNCGGLKILMPLSAAKSLVQLKIMKVIGCESMEEIVENENGGKMEEIVENENAVKVDIVFRKLRVLELLSLKKLKSFSKSCVIEFLCLEKLVVSECPKMESFSENVRTSPLLEKVFILHEEEKKIPYWNGDLNSTILHIFTEKKFYEGMNEISLSEHHDLLQVWNHGADCVQRSWFNCLKILKLEGCKNLLCAIPYEIFLCLTSLIELEVQNCNKVEVIFQNSGNNKAIRSQLKNLTLVGLSGLKHVWGENYQGNIRFQNLLHVSVCDCEGLETLFPEAVAKNIGKLETLQIDFCENLQQIVGKEVPADVAETFVFPCLTSLFLYNLPQLTNFYCGSFTVKCPELRNLVVLDCFKFELFQSEGEGSSTSKNRQPLFLNLQDISSLEELSVDWIKLESSLQLEKDLRLKCLKEIQLFFDVGNNENPTFPSDIFVKAPNLQDMSIGWCKNLERFETSNLKISEQLKNLTLWKVSNLKFIWSEDSSWLNKVCEKLHSLNVENCQRLRKLFCSPSAVSLCNLKELYITDCDGLEYLFTSSMVEVLKHLEKIVVMESRSIKEIIKVDQEGTTSQELEFKHLHCIVLDSLSSLEYFYSGSDTLKLPALALVKIQQCPNMKIFSQGPINTESFRGIHNSVQQIDDSVFYKDLNGSVKVVFLSQMLSKGMDGTEFSKHSELHEAWQDGLSIQNNWMYRLKTLKLVNCDIEPYAIPSKLFPCLKSLKILEVRSCNKVKQIFAKNDTEEVPFQLNTLILEDLSELTLVWEKKFRGIHSFQNMMHVRVIGCKSIQTLFPTVLAENLNSLEKLEVKSCDELREIVGKEEVATGSEKKFWFPRLTSLDLIKLQELTYFYPEIFTVECPELDHFSVLDCPKLKLFQGADPEGEAESVSASKNRQHFILNWCFCNLISLVVEGCEFLADALLPSHILPFLSNLKTLEVRNCNSIKAIFVNTKIGPQGSLNLPFLEKLCVENCKKLLEIVAKEETATKEANEVNTVFPRITILKLWNLHNLRCIYPGVHIQEWPMLKELDVTHCPQLKFFTTEFQSSLDLHSACQDSFPTILQAFVSLQKVTPCLKVLSLGKEEAQMIEEDKLHVDLQELNSIILQCFHDDTVEFPFVFFSKAFLPSFRKLVVRHSAFKEIFPSQTSDIDCTKILSQLGKLELRSLSLLKSIGFGHSWMGPFLENLETLFVRNCGGLKNLTPSTVSFSSLTKLHVKNCGGLKYLFTFSTAKTLCALEELCIANCKSLKEILAKEGDEYNYENEEDDGLGDGDEGEFKDGDDNEDESETEDGDDNEDESETEDGDGDTSEDELGGEGEETSVDEDEARIIFKQLKILKLGLLPKLGSFYSGCFTLKFPSLEQMLFTQCHNMKIFRLGDKVSKDLKVTIDGECPEGDINKVIMQQVEEERQSAELVSSFVTDPHDL